MSRDALGQHHVGSVLCKVFLSFHCRFGMRFLRNAFDLTAERVASAHELSFIEFAERDDPNSLRTPLKRDVNQQSLHVTLMNGKLKSLERSWEHERDGKM
jgi:hypothetical protein